VVSTYFPGMQWSSPGALSSPQLLGTARCTHKEPSTRIAVVEVSVGTKVCRIIRVPSGRGAGSTLDPQ
jgi:hypothetical protein